MIAPASRTTNFHYAIRNLVSAAEALERLGRRITYLNIGDPQAYGFRPPNHLVEAVARALREGFTGYAPSAGLRDARNAVAEYATALGAPTEPEHVLISSGASEAADLVLTALVNEADQVLLPAPGYPLYSAILNKLGATAIYYTLESTNGWEPSLEEVASLMTPRTRALLLINPNNPTGSIIPDETTKQLLELAAKHELLVIADEVYRELCFGKQPTAASVIAKDLDVALITLESLSKTHLIPGWRVGWLRYTHEERMTDLTRSIDRLASGRLCSPTPTQYAIRPALEGDRGFLDKFMLEIKERRDFVVASVKRTKELTCDEPSAAFYVMIKATDPLARTDEAFVRDLLEQEGVFVVPGSGFGLSSKQGFFRLVYLADTGVLGDVFARINRFLDTESKSQI
jgi:alanine-synthesizing transaminase